MGRKLLICAAVLLIAGYWLLDYDYNYSPSDHPASASVDFEDIQIENGSHGALISKSTYVLETQDGYYRFNLERMAKDSFTGRVMVYQDIHDESPITRDVLSAKGFWGDPEKVEWAVQNHRFQPTVKSSGGIIDYIQFRLSFVHYPLSPVRPYHLIPGSRRISEIIDSIKVGDRLTIKGFDVSSFKVDATNPRAGVWADAGCRTIIVTEIEIS